MLRPQAWLFSKVYDNNMEFKKKKKILLLPVGVSQYANYCKNCDI